MFVKGMSAGAKHLKVIFSGKMAARFLLSGANTLRLLGTSVFGLIINYTLLRFKSPVLLDSYIYCLTVAGVLLVICNWGGREYAVRELSLDVAGRAKAFGTILLGRLAIAAVFSIAVLVFPHIRYPLAVIALLLTRTVVSAFDALIIVQKKFRFSLIAELVTNGLFVIVLLSDGNTSDTGRFLWAWMLFEVIRMAAYAWLFKSHVSFRFPKTAVFASLKQAVPFFAVALAGFTCSRADLYVLGFGMTSADLSRYSILLNFIILCQVLYGAFFGAFTSNILRFDANAFLRLRQNLFWAGLVFAVAGALVVYALSILFFGEKLSWFFVLSAWINLFAFSNTFTSVYHFTRLNRQNVILKVIVVAGVLNVIASAMVVPQFGIYGAFACNTGCAALTALLFRLSTKPGMNA